MEQSAHELLLHLSSPGLCYSKTDISHAKKLTVMGKDALEARFDKFLRTHSQVVTAISYQSDATPQVLMETKSVADGHHHHISKGRRSAEFVLERFFAIAATGHRTVLLQWPVRVADKTAWTHVSLAAATLKYPFLFDCEAINIVHVCFDGALFTSLSDLLHRHHARALANAAEAQGLREGGLLALKAWFVATPCMNHAAHCSARWPLKEVLEEGTLMKDLWSIIESSRATKASVLEYAPWWLASRLVFRDWENDHCYRFWTMLGIESADCDELTELQLRVVDGTVFLAEDAQTDPDIINRVSHLLHRGPGQTADGSALETALALYLLPLP